MSPSRESIIETCDAYVEAMSVGDPARTVKLFTPGASHEEPIGTPVRHGHDEIFAFLAQYRDVGFTMTRLGPVTIVGNRGAFQSRVDVPTPDGTVSLSAVDIVTVDDDGLISGIVVLPDTHPDPNLG